MGSIDDMSEAIGFLRAGVKSIEEKIDHLHACLHSEEGIISRVRTVEETKAIQKGVIIGVSGFSGAVGGSVATALWKTILVKIGGG